MTRFASFVSRSRRPRSGVKLEEPPLFVTPAPFSVADSEGKLSSHRGSQLVHMTLMMHSWVVPSQTFAQKLLALYPPLGLGAADKHIQTFINQIRKQETVILQICFDP